MLHQTLLRRVGGGRAAGETRVARPLRTRADGARVPDFIGFSRHPTQPEEGEPSPSLRP